MGVCRHLCAMMKKMFGDRANEWVTCDATKREYVNGAGTFRYMNICIQILNTLTTVKVT